METYKCCRFHLGQAKWLGRMHNAGLPRIRKVCQLCRLFDGELYRRRNNAVAKWQSVQITRKCNQKCKVRCESQCLEEKKSKKKQKKVRKISQNMPK
mgnify:CR=1 FL=1